MSGVKMQVTSFPCLENAPPFGSDMPFRYEVSFKMLFSEIDLPNSAFVSADDRVMASSGKALQMQNSF